VVKDRNVALLVDVEPSAKAEEVYRNMLEGRQVGEGKLLLEANPAWAEVIETVLVAKCQRVKRLLGAGLDCAATNAAQWEEVTLPMES
jgi:hypothetical protein